VLKTTLPACLALLAGCITPAVPAASAQPAATVTQAPLTQVEVPFTMQFGRPVVMVSFAGHEPIPMVFDTGAQFISLARATAERFELPVTGTVQIGSPHGQAPVTVNRYGIEGVRLGGQAVLATEASAIPDDFPLPPDSEGVLGPAAFSSSVIEIDFPAQTLRIGPAPSSAPDRWFALDDNGFLSGTLQIAGTDVQFTLDAGNPMGIVVPLQLARQLAPSASLPLVGRVGMVDSSHALHVGRVDLPVTLGGMASRIGTLGAIDGGPTYANVGAGAMAGLILVIDKPNRRWGLRGTLPAEINMPEPQRVRRPG
jgi:hypothetical protein